jgi:hypothetical protein
LRICNWYAIIGAGEIPSTTPLKLMTPQQRLTRALQIRQALEALMTDEECDLYECLFDHFADYVSDLNIDLQRSLDDLPWTEGP